MALSRRSGQRFQASIWPGFVDAMTALLLVLMFVLTIFMVLQSVLRDTITEQDTELNQLNAQILNLADALGLEQKRSFNLEEDVARLDANLNDANIKNQAQLALIANLTAQNDDKTQRLAAQSAQISSFEAQVASLLAQRDDARSQGAALTQQLAEANTAQEKLISEQEALKLALATARDEIDQKVEEARLAAARTDALNAMIAEMQTDAANRDASLAQALADLEAQTKRGDDLAANLTDEQKARAIELAAAEALKKRLNDVEQTLSNEEAARLAEAAAAEALRARLKDADAELTAMTLALEEKRRNAEDTLAMLAAANAAGKDLDEKLAAALLAMSLTQTDLENTQSALEAARGQIASLEDVAGDKSKIEVELALALSAKLAAERAAQDARQQQLSTAADLNDAKARIEALSLIAREKDDLESKLALALAAIEAAKQDAGAAQTAQQGTQAELDRAIAQIKELGGVVAENSDLKTQLATALAAKLAAQRATDAAFATQAKTATELENALAQIALLAEVKGDRDTIRTQLAAALAAKLAAEAKAQTNLTKAQERAALLATTKEALAAQEVISTEAQRRMELLNQQVAALDAQIRSLQSLLKDSESRDAQDQVEIAALGQQLNAALARVAVEQRKRADLEAKELQRLAAEANDLKKYKSEFFGKLRDVLGGQEGVRIVGDRFVFSSEVLFKPGAVVLEDAGKAQIAQIANILKGVIDDIPEGIDWIIRVDGHTDNVPLSGFGQYKDNWELSQARALSVVRYMSEYLGIPPDRLAANGFGEYQPINTEDSDEARAQNRRIELKFTEK